PAALGDPERVGDVGLPEPVAQPKCLTVTVAERGGAGTGAGERTGQRRAADPAGSGPGGQGGQPGHRRGTGRYRHRHRPDRRHPGTGGQHGHGVRGYPAADLDPAVADRLGLVTGARFTAGAARYRLGMGPTCADWSPSSWTKMDRRSTASPRPFSSYPSSHAQPLYVDQSCTRMTRNSMGVENCTLAARVTRRTSPDRGNTSAPVPRHSGGPHPRKAPTKNGK